MAAAFVPVVGAAPAQEEPPTTTVTTPAPEPAPDPAPDPAPPVKPKPKAKPRSAPVRRSRPATPAPVPAPTYQAPSTYRAPSVRQETQVVRKPVRKAKKTSRSSAPTRPRPVTAPTITPVGGSLGASVSFGNPVQAGSGDAFDFGALLIVAGLSIGIACFTVALIPARRVPWRPAAIFVSERQLDLTLLGLAVLVTSGLLFFWVKGL